MYPYSLPYALILFAIAALTGGIAIYTFFYLRQAGTAAFAWTNVCMAAWSALYGIENLAPTLSTKTLAAQWEYIPFTLIPVFWLIFSLEYNGRKAWLTPVRIFALFVIPVFTITLAATNEYYHLIWEKVSLGPPGYPSINVENHGDWFFIHTIYSYTLILAGIAFFGMTYFFSQSVFRSQIKLILVGSMILLGINAITLFGPFELHGFDLTPIGFAVVSILTFVGYLRFNLLRLMPIASTLVLENLRDAVIVLDRQKLVVEINATARNWWRLGEGTIGREVSESLPMLAPSWERWNAGQVVQRFQMGERERERHFDASLLELYT